MKLISSETLKEIYDKVNLNEIILTGDIYRNPPFFIFIVRANLIELVKWIRSRLPVREEVGRLKPSL